MPEVATTAVNREYHLDAARKFMKRYQITFERHVLRNWDDSSKTHYLLAADPEHAYALARILKDCHEELNDIEKDDDE